MVADASAVPAAVVYLSLGDDAERFAEREITMNNKTEGVLSSLAAILVLFTTMLDPRISIGLAVAFLLGLSIYHFARKN